VWAELIAFVGFVGGRQALCRRRYRRDWGRIRLAPAFFPAASIERLAQSCAKTMLTSQNAAVLFREGIRDSGG
jgi:hypothetical protein